jgi:hypothetical protein
MPFNFNRAALAEKIAGIGTQPAKIADLSVSESPEATWLKVAFKLESGHVLESFVAIDAAETSPHLSRVGEGIALIEQLCQATGVDIDSLTEPREIMTAFLGKRVQASIVHKTAKGAPTAVIKLISALPEGQ